MNKGGNPRKRPPPSYTRQPSPATKHQATAPTPLPQSTEEDFVDEDVFLDETLVGEEDVESLILRNLEEREALTFRLSKWARPPLSNAYISQSRSIVFQQLEIDYVIGESHEGLLPYSSGPAAIIRIFGVTGEGHSVCCLVHGFEPYFYINCPPGMGPDDISHFHQTLEDRMKEKNKNSRVPKFVRRIELVQKRSIMYYQQQKSQPFLKIVMALPTMVASCRGILDRGIQIDSIDLISHAPEGEFSKMAPFRILSFDIECAGRKVANLVTLQGEDQPLIRNVMTLNSCSPIVGVDVMSFDTEKEVFLAWREFIREVDPDIIIGYNICKFDLPYLIERAQTLGIAEFPILGRIRNSRAMQRDYKLSSYSLNSVSAHFLSEQKEDVHHSIISDLQNGNAETRRRLAVYCLKDAYLPQRLLDKLMYAYNYVEMARVTGVPISFLLSRGQSIKVLSQLLRKSKQKNLVIPNVKRAGSEQGTYEGATVLEAKAGFYEKPIATLDFASLYPSIMMAYNLCYCTLVTPEDVRRLNLPPECVNRTPSGETFVKPNLQKGILPEILEDANSVYGFTGATVGQLPCLEISSSVTSYGRQMIEHTKKLVEDKFTVLGGYEHNAEVIYGDTDSVMVQFGVSDVEAAMNLGREAAEHISGTSTKPIKLEFEKVYYPYLLISKKRYAGLFWTNPKKDIPGAVQYVKNTISDLLMNRMDLSLFVITKGLTKTGDDYEVKAAHVELAERMRKRDAATAPNVGDRVPYVIIKAAKGAKAYERSEDPIYVLENNIPIDPQYYLENQISKPLLRIFEPILKNASKELLHGSHTRSISISTPSNSGIMKFAKKQLSCIGCKALISNADQTLCLHCKGREAEHYYKTVSQVSELEELFGRLWTQCQECQAGIVQYFTEGRKHRKIW
ncbi:DNA polymerase delta catalytic subunit [Hibiscus syriacus]|uniref:DNA polymerase n=1 Tax=Hibiscus syriacus TaxID=106335 RepID=A0A6A3CYG5_HIBSY|nr:DNA polymerase delta catalytic subunit [Hibiscus syriacus]